MATVLNINKIADKLKREISKKVRTRKNIKLASFTVGEDPSRDIYIRAQQRLASVLGVRYLLVRLKKSVSLSTAFKELDKLNKSPDITGIIIHKPLPKDWDEFKLFSRLDLMKDVEGLHPYNLGRIMLGTPLFIPPTVRAVLKIIEELKIKVYGKEIVIVGFSNILGKPLSIMLADKLATVSITHIATFKRGMLSQYVKRADVLITAVGKPYVIKGEWVKKGAIVIDVGISSLRGKIVGDVEFEVARERASFITPVPYGVGKLTTLYLFDNLVKTRR